MLETGQFDKIDLETFETNMQAKTVPELESLLERIVEELKKIEELREQEQAEQEGDELGGQEPGAPVSPSKSVPTALPKTKPPQTKSKQPQTKVMPKQKQRMKRKGKHKRQTFFQHLAFSLFFIKCNLSFFIIFFIFIKYSQNGKLFLFNIFDILWYSDHVYILDPHLSKFNCYTHGSVRTSTVLRPSDLPLVISVDIIIIPL